MSYIGQSPKLKRVRYTPQASDPSNPVAGDVFYSNGTPRAAGLWFYNGSAWIQLTADNLVYAVTSINNGDSPYTALSTDELILCDASSGAITINLPAAASNEGKIYIIKKTDSSLANIVTIDGNSSETIDGSTTTTLNTQYEALTIICDGSNWQILDRRIPKTPTVFTATFNGFGTVSTQEFRWWRDGAFLYLRGYFVSGTSTAAPARIDLPSGLAIITTTAQKEVAGVYYRNSTGTAADSRGGLILYDTDDTFLEMSSRNFFQQASGANAEDWEANDNANNIANSGDELFVDCKVQIAGWNG